MASRAARGLPTHGVAMTTKTEGLTALVLGGGGARGAYQVGALRAIARRHPDLAIPILTGISAGGINAAFLAAHPGRLADAAVELADLWLSLTPEQVYCVDAFSLLRQAARWILRLGSGGAGAEGRKPSSLMDTRPLWQFLKGILPCDADGAISGIDENIARGRLHGIAVSATSYSTDQSITWVHGPDVKLWQRPHRRSELARLRLDHVMASAALPLLFPAVRVGNEWFGDGGIRLTAPLSSALHLGASRILTISTRYERSVAEASVPQVVGYPPPAQVLGVLYNAVFLDIIDQDILRLELINRLLAAVPETQRNGLRPVEILVIRPSRDLGKLARRYEPRLPKVFRFFTRGWGTRRTTSADVLSMIMFQRDYLQALVDLGARDAELYGERIDAFVTGGAVGSPT